jgi:hypothetical protein
METLPRPFRLEQRAQISAGIYSQESWFHAGEIRYII